jgi:hypothetical protein
MNAIPRVLNLPNRLRPTGFDIPIDPIQACRSKVTIRVARPENKESSLLYLMSPNLTGELTARILWHQP